MSEKPRHPNQEGGNPDALFDRGVRIVVKNRRCSVGFVQRQLEIGYFRAARLVDQMVVAGVVQEDNNFPYYTVLLSHQGET